MEDQLISFETAKLAKEKGFDISCKGRYGLQSTILYSDYGFHINDADDIIHISAPTQSLLQKWLREVHNIHISITTGEFFKDETETAFWGLEVSIIGASYASYIEKEDFEGTYEETLEKGLFQALKLIKNN